MKLFSTLTAFIFSLQALLLFSLSNAQNDTLNLLDMRYSLPSVYRSAENVSWSYEGKTGPGHWAGADPSFFLCNSTRSYQSPINIQTSYAADRGGSGIRQVLKMRPSMYKMTQNADNVAFQCQNPRGCCELYVGCRKFRLVQFHFHSPSEHTINGDRKDFELHMVHVNEDRNIAVVGILFDEFREADDDEDDIIDLSGPLTSVHSKKNFPFDLRSVVDLASGYYRYPGSLTTPPCSDGVEWFVQTRPLRIRKEQIDAFRAMIGPIPRGNWRPTQDMHGRPVRRYTMIA